MAEEMDTFVESVVIENLVEVDKDEVADDNKQIAEYGIKEPSVGMVFGSFEEAKNFYDDYARSKGFAIRIRSTYRDRRGPDLSSALVVCTCEGYNQKAPKSDDEGKVRRSTSIVRSGCKASMRVTNIRGTSAWKVTVFSDHHNHQLFTQSNKDILKCNKRKSRAAKNPTEAMRSCDVYRQATRLAHMAGRSEEIYEVIMAVMEETFKKVSQMEKGLFNNDNCIDKASENPDNLDNGAQLIPQEALMATTNDKKITRKGKEMGSDIAIMNNGLNKWKHIDSVEDTSLLYHSE